MLVLGVTMLVCVSLAGAAEIRNRVFVLRFGADGRPESVMLRRTGEELLNLKRPGNGVEVTLATEGSRDGTTVRLGSVECRGTRFTASGGPGNGVRLTFEVGEGEGYSVFTLVEADAPPGTVLLRARIHMEFSRKVALVPLDPMAMPRYSHRRELAWPALWGRRAGEPAGSVALFAPRNDAEHDEILLRIWADGRLPHPKVEGGWTLERAREWLAEWQRRFVDQSTMILEAHANEDLYRLADFARDLGMKKVYLHTDSWRGEYWPVKHSFLHVNEKVFPAGERDFARFARHLADRGMGLAIHAVSCSIGNFDPDYVGAKPDARLATWMEGTLARPIDADAKVIKIGPDPGSTFPRQIGHEWQGPGTVRRWLNVQWIRIDNELVRVGSFEGTDGAVWTARGCRRGEFDSPAAGHRAGAPVAGLLRPYGMAFTAGADTTLLDEIAKRYAGFCNRSGVTHLELDGLEVHDDVPWGAAKFGEAVYRHIDHPVTSNTSSGSPMPFHVEYMFRSSAEVRRNHVRGGVAGGSGVPLILHADDRPATGPYEVHLKMAEMVGDGGRTFGLMKPRAMFGVSLDALGKHGLVPYIKESILAWRRAAPLVTDDVRRRIKGSFGRFGSALGQAGNQPATHVLYRAEKGPKGLAIMPFTMLRRREGDIQWGWGQEFGPLVPRQYMKPGDRIEVVNPYGRQEPEFVIRVMNALGEGAASPAREITPKVDRIRNVGKHKFSASPGGVRIETRNDTGRAVTNADDLPRWNTRVSMDKARGVRMTVTGDGSGAVLVLQMHGRGQRDYVVPLDFTGKRLVEIPTGEVAWADARWGWRGRARDIRYGGMRQARLGLGIVPPGTAVDVTVEGIRLMPETPARLVRPTVRVGNGSLAILGDVPSGRYIWYRGRETVSIHDLNWREIETLPVRKRDFAAPGGKLELEVRSRVAGRFPWLEVQFFVRDEPLDLPSR
jgi:hypothetical protein